MVELSGGSAESSPGKNKFLGTLPALNSREDTHTIFSDSFVKSSIKKAPVVRESTRIREAFFDTWASLSPSRFSTTR